MTQIETAADAARLLQLRRAARTSLEAYAAYIEIPGRPTDDEDVFEQVESGMALHHRVICQRIQATMEREYGRLMILAPPGSAKSSMASIVAPTWAMGRWPKKRLIIAGHNSDIAKTQSRKARQIARSRRFETLFDTMLPGDQRAADEWALTNGSTMIAGGVLSGIAGHRVDGIIFDDPHASREAAESETQRTKVWEEWRDNLRNRVTPGGFVVGMLTRWHALDWAGMILPPDWNGQSGTFEGSDGLEWEVLCLKAKIETVDDARYDPLGRDVGEYIWPEWFTLPHWRQKDPALGSREANTPTGRRSWYSMEQQVPHPDDGILFRREDFCWYEPGTEPSRLRVYMAADWALTDELLKPDPDWTRVLVAGLDDGHNDAGAPALWFLDAYSARQGEEVTVPAVVRLMKKWRSRLRKYIGEQGNIETLIGGLLKRECKDQGVPQVPREILPTAGQGNKVAKSGAFRKLVAERRVYLPIGRAWAEEFVEECLSFPNGSHDDFVDGGSLLGRAMDRMLNAEASSRPEERERALTPFTYEWWERQEQGHRAEEQARAEYFD
jgi:predicted phage terminase large subunit-like protein